MDVRRMMKWLGVVLLLLCLAAAVAGCVAGPVDPETGQKTFAATPAVDKIATTTGEAIQTAGPVVTAVATAINPAFGGIVGLVLGVAGALYGTYKKWRVPLTESNTLLVKTAAGLRAAGDVIEEVVKPQVDAWAKAKPILKNAAANGAINADKLPLAL